MSAPTPTRRPTGIHQFTLDLATGALTKAGGTSGVANPSFLAISPDHKFLYAVGEVGSFNGKKGGAVSAFAIDAKTGELTLLNQQSSGGDGPCFITVDRAGKNVLVANYGGGSVASSPSARRQARRAGSLRPAQGLQRQQEPPGRAARALDQRLAATTASPSPADLGLDKVLVYKLDAEKGTLTPNDPPVRRDPARLRAAALRLPSPAASTPTSSTR